MSNPALAAFSASRPSREEREKQERLDTLWSQLIRAARGGDPQRMAQCLAEGADPLRRQSDGCTALMWAAYGQSPECVAILEPLSDRSVLNFLDANALIVAAATGNAKTVAALLPLRDPAEALHRGQEGRTALIAAAGSREEGAAECVRLLAPLSDIEAKNDNEETALMVAAEHGNVQAIKILLDLGAKSKIANRRGQPLMHAAILGSDGDECVRALLPVFDPNETDEKGESAMDYAIGLFNWEAFCALETHWSARHAERALREGRSNMPDELAARLEARILRDDMSAAAASRPAREDGAGAGREMDAEATAESPAKKRAARSL